MGIGIGTVLAATSTLASVAQGVSAQKAATSEAEASVERTEAQARQRVRDTMELEKEQQLRFLKSGVSLEGSPLLVLAETRDIGAEDTQNILEAGRQERNQIMSQGRGALFSGLTQAAGTAAKGFTGGFEDMAGQSVTKSPTLFAPPRKPLR